MKIVIYLCALYFQYNLHVYCNLCKTHYAKKNLYVYNPSGFKNNMHSINNSHWFFLDLQSCHLIKQCLVSKIPVISEAFICHIWRCNHQNQLFLNTYIKSCHCSKGAITVNNFISRVDPKKLKRHIIACCVKQTCKKEAPNLTFKYRVKSSPRSNSMHVKSFPVHKDMNHFIPAY